MERERKKFLTVPSETVKKNHQKPTLKGNIMTDTKTKAGRAPLFADKANLHAALVAVREGVNVPSRTLCLQLVEMGLVEIQKEKTGEGRGAPKHNYVLSGAGKSRVALLGANLKRANEKAAKEAVEAANAAVEAARANLAAMETAAAAAVANLAALVAEPETSETVAETAQAVETGEEVSETESEVQAEPENA